MSCDGGWSIGGGPGGRIRTTMGTQTMVRPAATKAQKGFTLIEVLIAMSILAVGAASILSIFTWAVAFYQKRVEDNRLTGVYNHVVAHALARWNEFDPASVQPGQPKVPPKIVADLRGDVPPDTTDPMILDAWQKYRGFQYTITFEESDLFPANGQTVVADIEIRGLSGERDEASSHKFVLSRTNAPLAERFRSPSLEERDKQGQRSAASGKGP
jgi:prepilin-type N-terminal cleavage/methylation domain-containing protein